MPSRIELNTEQVAAVLEISSKRVQQAVVAGGGRPAMRARERGRRRLYNFEEVVWMKVFDILVKGYGLQRRHAARMLSRAWPQPFTRRRRVLIIPPATASPDEVIELAPIKLPLGEIVAATQRRIHCVLAADGEKKTGRPQGWTGQMLEALTDVSEHLQGVSDEQIRQEIGAYRADRRRRAGR